MRPSLGVDQIVGPYRVVAGSSAGVCRAVDAQTGEPVALQLVGEDVGVGAGIEHPAFVPSRAVLDVAGVGRVLVSDWVDGEPLADAAARRTLSLETRVGWVREVGAALADAHDAGAIHGDLRASDVVVTPEGSLKIRRLDVIGAPDGVASDDQVGWARVAAVALAEATPGTSVTKVLARARDNARASRFRSMHAALAAFDAAWHLATGVTIASEAPASPLVVAREARETRDAQETHDARETRDASSTRRSRAARPSHARAFFVAMLAGFLASGGIVTAVWWQSRATPRTAAEQHADEESPAREPEPGHSAGYIALPEPPTATERDGVPDGGPPAPRARRAVKPPTTANAPALASSPTVTASTPTVTASTPTAAEMIPKTLPPGGRIHVALLDIHPLSTGYRAATIRQALEPALPNMVRCFEQAHTELRTNHSFSIHLYVDPLGVFRKAEVTHAGGEEVAQCLGDAAKKRTLPPATTRSEIVILRAVFFATRAAH